MNNTIYLLGVNKIQIKASTDKYYTERAMLRAVLIDIYHTKTEMKKFNKRGDKKNHSKVARRYNALLTAHSNLQVALYVSRIQLTKLYKTRTNLINKIRRHYGL